MVTNLYLPPLRLIFIGLFCVCYFTETYAAYPYFGKKIGSLTQLHHGVSGDVYAVDSRTIFLKDFNYDGEAPAAYFYVGNTKKPSGDGWRLRDETGSTAPIKKRYRNKSITLSLPEGKTLRDVKWFSVWCDEFTVNFGDVTIPSNLDFPKPQKVDALNGVHGVNSDNIVIVDAQTLLIPNFSYDGEAPDAKFWVGRGAKPSPEGLRIPDENGSIRPLRHYESKTIVLTLPGDLTVFDIGHFGVWCEAFTVDFGHIRIPDGFNVPPSLRMLGITPQSKLNCEVLYDDLAFEVRWAVAGESIVVQLVAKLEDGEYMSFGVSPNKQHTEMIGADVVVAWVDKKTGKGYAQDYYLDDKSQCSGDRGSCPDNKLQDKTDSIRLLNAAMVNGYSIVTYQRSLKANDKYDLAIFTNSSQAIAWAIGPLNQRNEVSFHSKYTKNDQLINFGRQPTWNCPMPEANPKEESSAELNQDDNQSEQEPDEEYYESRPQQNNNNNRRPSSTSSITENNNRRGQQHHQSQTHSNRRPVPTPKPASKSDAWEIPPIQCNEPDDGVFYAQLGPTGGKHGYPAITGHVGWGISWYINGLLIPEIHLVRGKTYTFVVEGGDDSEIPAKYHPFYITNDSIGGYEHKTEEEKAAVQIYAGIHKTRSGKITPSGIGRLCNWTPDSDGPEADEYLSFGAYQRTLTLKCDEGLPGVITWTPDHKTPDTVYYQCFTHRYLGWKIHIHDTCEESQASEIDEVYVEGDDDFLGESSIRHETKIRPNDNFLLQHEKDLIKHHNMAGKPPKLNFDITKSSEITRLITDGIRAAEALEDSISKNKTISSFTSTHHQVPQIQLSVPEVLEGEIPVSMKNYSANFNEYDQQQSYASLAGLSAYLRPPSNKPPPNFRETSINIPANRRPTSSGVQVERRPQRPVVLPQPSMIINHYRKAIPAIMKPFIKEKPFPIQSIASVLMLGQPTELGPQLQLRQNEPILKSKPFKQSVNIPVPYIDSTPQDSKKKYAITRNGSTNKSKIPLIRIPAYPEKPLSKPIVYKKPFEVKEIKESSEMSENYPPAINTGFQAERVIIESGFRPIVRRRTDGEIEEIQEKTNRRQDDAGAEIDEVMETDTLFLNPPQDQNSQFFEPMFIPSPPDSTNSTISAQKLLQNNRQQQLLSNNDAATVMNNDEIGAAAAERLDIYYLPPDTRKRPGFNSGSTVPDGAVVTYDGKAVLDTSLVNIAPPRLPFNDAAGSVSGIAVKSGGNNKLSKIEHLVRTTPQFAPFRGEMPPPVPDFLPKDAPQNHIKSQKPITEYSNPLANKTASPVTSPISTKLTLLRTSS